MNLTKKEIIALIQEYIRVDDLYRAAERGCNCTPTLVNQRNSLRQQVLSLPKKND